MGEPIDYRGYPTKPRKLDELSWFYLEPRGLTIVNEPIEGARNTQIHISWRRIIAAVDCHFKAKRKANKRR